MSKLEDKLSASIKPKHASPVKPSPGKPVARPRAPAQAPAADLNAPGQPLHPTRIWPD